MVSTSVSASASALFALCSQDDLIALLPKQKQNKIKKAIINFIDSTEKVQDGLKIIKEFKKVHNKQIKRQEKAKETIKEINKLLRKIKKEKEQLDDEIEQLSERESIESDETKDIEINEYDSDDEKSTMDDENSIYYEFDLNKKKDVNKLKEYLFNYDINLYGDDGSFLIKPLKEAIETYFRPQHFNKREMKYINAILNILSNMINGKRKEAIKEIIKTRKYRTDNDINSYLCDLYIKGDETSNNQSVTNLMALLWHRANGGIMVDAYYFDHLLKCIIDIHNYFLEGKNNNVHMLYIVVEREMNETEQQSESESEDEQAPPLQSESESEEEKEEGYYIGGSNVKWYDTETESDTENFEGDLKLKNKSDEEEEQIKYNLNHLSDENYMRVECEQVDDNSNNIDFYDLEKTKNLNHLVDVLFYNIDEKISRNDNLYYHFTEIKELRKRYKKTKETDKTKQFKKFKYNQLLHLTIEMMENKYNVDRLNINHFMLQYKIIPNGDFTNPYNIMALYHIMANNDDYDKNQMKSYIIYFYAKCLYYKQFNNIMLDYPENEDENGNIIYEYSESNKYDKLDMITFIKENINIPYLNINDCDNETMKKDLIIKFMRSKYADTNDDYNDFDTFLSKNKYTHKYIEKFLNTYYLYDNLNEDIKISLDHLRIRYDNDNLHNNIIPLIYTYLMLEKYNELDNKEYHVSHCMILLMYCFCELAFKNAYENK
jgi:hypothetical protein